MSREVFETLAIIMVSNFCSLGIVLLLNGFIYGETKLKLIGLINILLSIGLLVLNTIILNLAY